MITKENFGTYNGNDVFLFTLDAGGLLSAQITNFGGIVKSLYFKNTDVVLGRDTLEEYLKNDGYYGAIIGRNSNRIKGAKFELGGKTYTVAENDGANNLHGGNVGFNSKVWSAEAIDGAEPSLRLSLVSPDGEEGFPGTANITVTYTVTHDNSLKIHYEATCDTDTIMNLTNHSYFNLNGHTDGTIDEHTISVNSDFCTPNTNECIPNGEIRFVNGTVFDLRKPKRLADVFASDDEQKKMFGGFDHNFCLNGRGFRKVASLCGDKSGIKMDTYTDLPGIQIYSGNAIIEDRVCKDGAVYKKHQAICLETQAFPNSINFSHFPSPVLKKGEKYDTTTEYKFM